MNLDAIVAPLVEGFRAQGRDVGGDGEKAIFPSWMFELLLAGWHESSRARVEQALAGRTIGGRS